MEINFENFIKFNIQVGTIVDVKENKKARKLKKNWTLRELNFYLQI